MNDKQKPSIRFKGFTEAWEQRKLGEVATFINGRAYSQPELLSSGKYKILRVGNFYTNDSWYYSDLELGEKYYANYGDLLYTWSATFGPHIWLGDRVIYHYHIWKVVLSNQLEKQFTVQLLEQDKDNILSGKNGSTMVHITKEGMEQKDVIIPQSIKEQQQIGYFFKKLDHLITLHQRKYDKLVNVKKSMLEKMFPRDGKNVPEIRFSGFTEAWEQRKLGDIASDMVAGGDIDKDLILAEGQYPVIANALTGDGIVGYYDKEYRVNAPAVTVTGRGDVGHAKARLVNFTPVVRLLSVKSEHDVFFLENAINTLKIVIESTGVPQLTVPQLAKYEVAFPLQLDEEEHIGAFFKQLDHLITLHQREVEKLQNIKKSCLEKMFV